MIITIEDNISDDVALELVSRVVKDGKMSHDTKGNEFYCWMTVFRYNSEGYSVQTRRNLNQPSFIVSKYEQISNIIADGEEE